jgi:multicomponent Na+:H+ antiporter subunit D
MDFFSSHLASLPIIIPFIAAVFCAISSNNKIAWVISILSCFSSLVISLIILSKLQFTQFITYNFVGIEFKISNFNLLILLIIQLSVTIFSFRLISYKQLTLNSISLSLYLLMIAGLSGVSISNNLFNIFIFLEISAIASYILLTINDDDKKTLTASHDYLLSSTVGAFFILFGIVLIYIKIGTLNIDELAVKLKPLLQNFVIKTGCFFLLVGSLIKLGLIPFHSWLTRIYYNSSANITAFFTAVNSKVNIFLLIKIIMIIFAIKNVSFMPLIYFGVLNIIISSVAALRCNDAVKILIYSSICQLGYIIIMIGQWSYESLTAVILLMINHSMAESTLFFIYKDPIMLNYKKSNHIIFLNLASLIGLPISIGFMAKWYMLQACCHQQFWWLFILIIISSLIGAISYLKLWRIFNNNNKKTSKPGNISIITVWGCTILNILLLAFSSKLTSWANNIAYELIG